MRRAYLGLDSALLPSDAVTLGKQMNHSESVLFSKMDMVPCASPVPWKVGKRPYLRSPCTVPHTQPMPVATYPGLCWDPAGWKLILCCWFQLTVWVWTSHLTSPGLCVLTHMMAIKGTFVGLLWGVGKVASVPGKWSGHRHSGVMRLRGPVTPQLGTRGLDQ